MTRPSTDNAIDEFVARMRARGLAFRPIDGAPWIERLEQRLPHRFPPSFRSLVGRYMFEAFDLAGCRFFANSGDPEVSDELAVRMYSDRFLAEPLLANGYLQIGKSGTYDPVCFDSNRKRGGGECPIVTFFHEPVLMSGDTRNGREIACSFLELIASS